MNPKTTWLLVALAACLAIYVLVFERRPAAGGPVDRRVLPGISAAAVTGLQVTWTGKPAMRVELTNGVWRLTQPLPYPAQEVAITSLLRALEKLTFRTQITPQELKDHPEADEEYGLRTPSATIVVLQGRDEKHIKLGKLTAPGNEVYLQVVGGAGITTVDKDLFQYLPRDPDPWRDHTVVNLGGQAFDRLILTGGGKVEAARIELQRDAAGEPWRMAFPIQARVDNNAMDQIWYNLQALNATAFYTDDTNADLEPLGLQPAQLEVSLNRGTNVLAALQFGKSPTNDPTVIYARRSGQRTVMLVPRAPVEPLRGPYTDFRDRHLVGRRAFAAEVLTITTRGGEKLTLQRQTNDEWRVTAPAAFPADARQMRKLLENLANLECVPVNNQFSVKENVLPAELAKWGLAPPARQYLLQRAAPAGATNTTLVELDFGGGTDDQDKVYVRRTDESSVYAARLADFNKLPVNALQLRDRRVWRFAESNVVSLTVRQGRQTVKVLREGEYKYALAPGSPGTLDPNDPMIEAALGDLGELDAEDWINSGDNLRARYHFAEQPPRITVEVRGAGRSDNLELDLGGWSPDKLRYAAVRLEGREWILELPTKVYQRLISFLKLEEPLTP